MKAYLGADHRGYALKEHLKAYLTKKGVTVEDMGAFSEDPTDDYPDFALPVARAVAAHPDARGILLCGSGMGMDVAANKVRSIRATVGYSRDAVVHGRAHDNVNVITFSADTLSEADAEGFADAFLETDFSGEARHVRRIEKIEKIEDASFK